MKYSIMKEQWREVVVGGDYNKIFSKMIKKFKRQKENKNKEN